MPTAHLTVTYAQLVCTSHLFYDLNEAPKCHSNADSPDCGSSLSRHMQPLLECGIHQSTQQRRGGAATLICRQLISKRQSKARTRLMREASEEFARQRRQVQQNRFAPQTSKRGSVGGGGRSYPCAACCINHADCPIQQRYVSLLHFIYSKQGA